MIPIDYDFHNGKRADTGRVRYDQDAPLDLGERRFQRFALAELDASLVDFANEVLVRSVDAFEFAIVGGLDLLVNGARIQ